MTTPSRINEILREMEQDPALAQALRDTILGQEIPMLPAAVAQNQGLIIRLMERQVELASAVNTALDAVVSAISQAGENTARALDTHGRRIEGVESALAELRGEGRKTQESLGQVLAAVKQFQTDMTQVKTDVKQLQSDMTETKADVKQLQSDMTQVKTDVRRIDGRLDRGFGTNYESKVAQNVRSILGQQTRVRSSRVLKGPSLRIDPDFDRHVENAEASGAITEDESDELLLLDLIIVGTRSGTRERIYTGIEVSITANDDDVNRAADRVEILRKVTGGQVMAAVIAARVDEPQRELAARRKVTVAVHPE